MKSLFAVILFAGLCGCSTMEPNVDRFGSDYNSYDLPSANPALCKMACDSDPQCKAWTYVRPNTTRGPNPRCYLKNPSPAPTPASCCISGTKVL